MNKNAVLILIFLVFGLSEASASLVQIGRLPQNDTNVIDIEAAIQRYTGSHVDVYFYDRLEDGKSTPKTTTTFAIAGNIVIGTWDVIDPLVMISYLTVKAGNDYGLYKIAPGSNSDRLPGTQWDYNLWTTQLFDSADTSTVPEPVSFALVTGALAAVYAFRRKLTFAGV